MYYYAHHLGKNKNQRDKYKDHEILQMIHDFCEKYFKRHLILILKVCQKTLHRWLKRIFSKNHILFFKFKNKVLFKAMINS